MSLHSVEKWNRPKNARKLIGIRHPAEQLERPKLMTIGQLARKTGVTSRAIRHYERLGLVETPRRTDANYRLFDSDSVSRVKFIANCRSLGFSIPEIANFLQIMENPDHTCSQVAELTRRHLDIVDTKIRDLAKMRQTLARNLACCTGNEVPECPVLDLLQKSS